MSPRKGTKNNPTGKGGFQDHPEIRNTKGRPPSGQTMADMVKNILEQEVPIKDENGKIIEKVTYKKAIAKAIVLNAMKGREASQRLIMQYDSGMPNQPISFQENIDPDNFVDEDDVEMAEREIERLLTMTSRAIPSKKPTPKRKRKKK